MYLLYLGLSWRQWSLRDTQSKKMLPIETFVVAMKTITVTVAILKGEYLLFVNWVHADQRQVLEMQQYIDISPYCDTLSE